MQEIRKLESLINKFQNEFRTNLHKKELTDYINKGLRIQKDYYDDWENVFEEFKNKAEEDIKKRVNSSKKISALLYENKYEKIQNMKPKNFLNKINKLKDQEKLLGINERTEEAIFLKTELKNLSKDKDMYVERKKLEEIPRLNLNYEKFQNLEKQKSSNKKQKELNFLLVKKNKASDVFYKKINMHIKDIETIHGEISGIYFEKGKIQEELRRAKIRQINTNLILQNSKLQSENSFNSGCNSTKNSSYGNKNFNLSRVSNFKNTINTQINFGISNNNCFNSTHSNGMSTTLGNFILIPDGFYYDLALALLNLPNNFCSILDNSNNFKSSKTLNYKNYDNSGYDSNKAHLSNFDNVMEEDLEKKSNVDHFNSISRNTRRNKNENVIKSLQFLIKHYNLPSWDINKESITKKFCNVKEEKECPKTAGYDSIRKVSKLRTKITKLLESRKGTDELEIPILNFYDEDLKEFDNRDILIKKENLIKNKMIVEENNKNIKTTKTKLLPIIENKLKNLNQ